MKFTARLKENGFDFGSEYNIARFKDFTKKNVGMAVEITPITPESRYQRGFYHGAVLSLWAYLNDMDYMDNEILDFLHQEAKKEFNGEFVLLDGKSVKKGKSSKGELNRGFLERIINYLEESYGIKRGEVLNPEHYKDFRDRVNIMGDFDSYIDYLVSLNLLDKTGTR